MASITLERPIAMHAPAPRAGEFDHASAHERRGAGRRVGVPLVGIVVFGAVLRLWGLGANRLGYDEAFTAMAGRRPLDNLFSYLRLHDSHPPLDYLLRAPLARAGANEFLIRLPSVAFSIGALALFAWWVRRFGVAGVIATALLAVSAFQLVHGRGARMYGELELIGVVAAVLADSWLRHPRRWHAPALAALVLVGLLTHVSMFLLGGGLLAVAGLRRDREAWRWRAAVAAGGLGWAVLWGPSFLTQMRGGHSSWIPRTTGARVVDTFGRLLTNESRLFVVALVAVAAGAVVVTRRDRRLGRVVVCCALIPAALAAAAGTVAPVLIDRTITVAAWAPLLAIGFLLGNVTRRSLVLGAAALVVVAAIALPATANLIGNQSTPDVALRHLEQVARAGDTVAIRPAGKLPEIAWSIGVRGRYAFRVAPPTGLANTSAIVLGRGPATGRIWLLDWNRNPLLTGNRHACARPWSSRSSRVLCLR